MQKGEIIVIYHHHPIAEGIAVLSEIATSITPREPNPVIIGGDDTLETISIKTGVLRDWGYTGWWDNSQHRPNLKADSYRRNKERK